jgi:hypothetical protein
MKILRFTDGASINVDFVVDLLGNNTGNLTVMEIKGLDTAEEALMIGFKKIPSSLDAFKAFAVANNLLLTKHDQAGSATVGGQTTTTTTTAAPTTTTTTTAEPTTTTTTTAG